jgi:hypothetical protein
LFVLESREDGLFFSEDRDGSTLTFALTVVSFDFQSADTTAAELAGSVADLKKDITDKKDE